MLWYTKRGLSAEDLHAALEDDVHIKTIKRDMQAVASGFPEVRLERSAKRWVLRADFGGLLNALQEKPHISRKVCIGCKKPKLLDEFHNCRSYPDGKWPECKLCRNEYNKQYYADNYKRSRVTARDDKGRYLKTTGKRRRRKYELKST